MPRRAIFDPVDNAMCSCAPGLKRLNADRTQYLCAGCGKRWAIRHQVKPLPDV